MKKINKLKAFFAGVLFVNVFVLGFSGFMALSALAVRGSTWAALALWVLVCGVGGYVAIESKKRGQW